MDARTGPNDLDGPNTLDVGGISIQKGLTMTAWKNKLTDGHHDGHRLGWTEYTGRWRNQGISIQKGLTMTAWKNGLTAQQIDGHHDGHLDFGL